MQKHKDRERGLEPESVASDLTAAYSDTRRRVLLQTQWADAASRTDQQHLQQNTKALTSLPPAMIAAMATTAFTAAMARASAMAEKPTP